MGSELRPRLCFLTKGRQGYGFHLHGERNRGGQLIRKIEPGSCADLSGLRPGDRVVEVNGHNVEHDTHHQVVDRIREVEHRTRLLVIDRDTDDYLHSRGLSCTEDLAPIGCTANAGHVRPDPKACWVKPLLLPLPLFQMPSECSSPPTPDAAVLVPRLCHLTKRGEEPGYGFNLHSDKLRPGQFVGSVDPGSAAERADVRKGDRLVQVNGMNIEGLRHSEVVALIQRGGKETRLLVVDLETDELFLRLRVVPNSSHIEADTPIINITLTDSPIKNSSPKPRTNGSSASHSSRGSTTQSEFSSSDMSIQVPDEDEKEMLDPFLECGLRLSPTAAEAKEKAIAKRNKKRAPPMDWNRKYEIFSNF
ncbi:unnamed protein product [Merluccius merluccius]